MKEIVANKEKVIKEQTDKLISIADEFEKYRCQYNSNELKSLNSDLMRARQKVEELEKQNREVTQREWCFVLHDICFMRPIVFSERYSDEKAFDGLLRYQKLELGAAQIVNRYLLLLLMYKMKVFRSVVVFE